MFPFHFEEVKWKKRRIYLRSQSREREIACSFAACFLVMLAAKKRKWMWANDDGDSVECRKAGKCFCGLTAMRDRMTP